MRQDVIEVVGRALEKICVPSKGAEQLITLLDKDGYAIIKKNDLKRAVESIINELPDFWPTRRG